MLYHERSGEAILALLMFRVVWGCIGSTPSRFRTFLAGPTTVFRYVLTLFRRDADPHLSHNPMGGWSVMAMLLALLIQAGTGLFANDDIATAGPLYKWVSKAASDRLTAIHHLNHDVIIILVVVHVAAVLFHLAYKKENLITPMITGIKQWRAISPGSIYSNPSGWRPWWERLRQARFICWCVKKAGQRPAFLRWACVQAAFSRDRHVPIRQHVATGSHSHIKAPVRRCLMKRHKPLKPTPLRSRLTCCGMHRGRPCSWHRPLRTEA